MNYYYDVVLNFLEGNYLFYEWDEFDNLEVFKKIPLFHVSSKTMKDFINNQVVVDKAFLELINNKAKGSNSNNVALFADKNGSIALEFDDNGNTIARSFLQIDDELNIGEILYTTEISEINYKLGKPISYQKNLRKEEKIKRLINTEISSLITKHDYEKLKYLYMEWFNKDNKSIESMVNVMKNKLKGSIGEKELKIYNLIKLSYSKV